MERLKRRPTIIPDQVNPEKIKRVGIARIISFIVVYQNVSISDVMSKKRNREIAETRQIIVYFLSLKNLTWKRIGSYVGHDHACAIHSRNSIENFMFSYKFYYAKIQYMAQQIESLSNK